MSSIGKANITSNDTEQNDMTFVSGVRLCSRHF